MVVPRQLNPSSIHVRIGLANDAWDQAAWNGDLERVGNILGTFRTHAAVFMKPGELDAFDALPGYATGDNRTPQEVLRDMENRRIELLILLRDRQGVGAKPDIEIGDSDSLDQEVPA